MTDFGITLYSFPENRRAARETVSGQLCKLQEEAGEASAAYVDKEGAARVVEEVLDTIQAAEGVLRKFDQALVLACYSDVVEKCRSRGDY